MKTRAAVRAAVRVIIIVAAVAIFTFTVGCPIKRLTGFDCPFCGMTRAHLAFFSGRFAEAMEYNELFFLGVPILCGVALIDTLRGHKKLFIADTVFLSCAFCAIIVRYIIHMI